jgi:peroxiredoxin
MLHYSSPAPLVVGQPAPDFNLLDLQGEVHSLSDYRGRLVVMYFWSAECPSVARADTQMAGWLPTMGNPVVVLPIASNANEEPEMLARVAFERSLSFVLRDAGQRIADTYRAATTPHFFVITPKGRLGYQGALDNVTFRQRTPTRFYLREAVSALLAGQTPDPAETQPYGCTIVRFKP